MFGSEEPAMTIPLTADLPRTMLHSVTLLSQSPSELCFRVTDPEIYPRYDSFDLVFRHAEPFSGPHEMDDVTLHAQSATLPHTSPQFAIYEFRHCETVPTEGRPYQVEVQINGAVSALHGVIVENVIARIVALDLVIRPVPEQAPDSSR
jgi:hypothetical protein